MSFTSTIHNRLKEYIQTAGQSEKQILFRELATMMPSPLFITGCDTIPQEHPLKQEAWIVSDAFEAVTNGMFSFELSRQLEQIREDSLLHPWAVLTKAVEAFYNWNTEEGLKILSTLPEDSAPGRFRDFFSALMNKKEFPEEWMSLKDAVLDDTRDLKSGLEQLAEAAQAGMEDLMLETAGMIIRDIRKDHPDRAAEILIWTFEQLQESDVLSDKAAEMAQLLFGETEGLRLTALSTLSFDQDRSLIYWLLALQSYLQSRETRESEVKAYLRVICDVAETVTLEFELTEEYLSLLITHTESLVERLHHIYPDLTSRVNPDHMKTSGEILSLLQVLSEEEQVQPGRVHKKTIQNTPAPVQLELFGF